MTFSDAHIANWARMQEEAQRSQEAFVSRFINPPTKKESAMIKPTIGRVVWLWPTNLLNGIQARAMLERVLGVTGSTVEPFYARSTPVEPSLSPFDFGSALNVLRLGGKVARKGWNGKGMWVTMAGPIEGLAVNHEKFWSPNNAKFAKDQPDGAVTVNPYFTIKNTDNTISNWVPSTGDILALDWVTVQ